MIATRLSLVLALAAAGLLAACGADEQRTAHRAGIPTAYDSTGDTVRAQVLGAVDSADLRTLVAELRLIGETGDSILFANAGELAVNTNGALAVNDLASTQLLLFSSSGAFIGKMGRQGSGPGEYREINGFVPLVDSTWAVYDRSSSRVSFFGPDGAFRDSWNVPATVMEGSGMLASDSARSLRLMQFVLPPSADFASGKAGFARIVGRGAALADTALVPTLGVKNPEYRAVRSIDGNRYFTTVGSRLAPSEMTLWHPDGHWVLMEGGAYRVLFAKRDSRPIVVTRDAQRIVVDDDERRFHEERTLWTMRRSEPGWTWRGDPIPKVRAPAQSMFVARDGVVWVQVALPSAPIPVSERDVQRPDGPPVRRWRERSAYEVFDRNGTFLGRVTLPPRTTLHDAIGDLVWGTELNESDVPVVVRWRVTPSLR